MRSRGIRLLIVTVAILLGACTHGSVTAPEPNGSSGSPASLGGCPHAPSPATKWPKAGAAWQGAFEVRGSSIGGGLWVLRSPPHRGVTELTFAAGGTGNITVVAIDDADSLLQPEDIGFLQGGIIGWDRPGLQFLGHFRFPHGGCWALQVSRGALSGAVWLSV